MMCHTVTQAFKHICNVIIGYVGGTVIIGYVGCMNKSMLDLYKKLESQERGEKREKMDSNWISCLSLLYFFSFSPQALFLSCQYSSLLTQEKQRRSFSCVCLLSENKKPFFFTYDVTRSYITQILEYFCQGQIACNGQLYFQLLWEAYSGTCDALSLLFSQGVPCSSVSTSKLYMST